MAETVPGTDKGSLALSDGDVLTIEIEHLVKQFGRVRAVDNLTMSKKTGETYGLIGPNGSGKTTLIRMMVGLVRPTGDSIRIFGMRMPTKVLPHVG